MLEIKPYCDTYKEDLREVCLNTAFPQAREPKYRNYLLNSYCDYYLENEPSSCFAAVDENGVAQGYILCAPCHKKYSRFVRPYAKQAAKSGIEMALEGISERAVLAAFSKLYPAHLHIDINPGFQGQGTGAKLMSALLSHLKNTGVKGVMLIVGSGNKGAIRFYMKCGFKKTAQLGPGTVMTYNLR